MSDNRSAVQKIMEAKNQKVVFLSSNVRGKDLRRKGKYYKNKRRKCNTLKSSKELSLMDYISLHIKDCDRRLKIMNAIVKDPIQVYEILQNKRNGIYLQPTIYNKYFIPELKKQAPEYYDQKEIFEKYGVSYGF